MMRVSSSSSRIVRRLQRITGRDHLIQGEVRSCRVSVVDCTQTLREARRRWKMCPIVTECFGEMLISTVLHSSLLSGEERTIATITGDAAVRSLTLEAMRAGEVRGSPEPVSVSRVALDVPDKVLGSGVLEINKILYNRTAPIRSVVPSDGDVLAAWRQFYLASEQIPSWLHAEVHLGPDGEPSACAGVLLQVPPASP